MKKRRGGRNIIRGEECQRGHESLTHTVWCISNVGSKDVPSDQCLKGCSVQGW